MSLENNLKRIADSLEKLVELKQSGAVVLGASGLPGSPSTTNQPAAAPPAAAPPAAAPPAAAPPAAAPPAAAPPAAAMTPEEMNNALVAEFKRLGDRTKIDQAMAQLGVTSVNDLPAGKQQELLAAVRALQP